MKTYQEITITPINNVDSRAVKTGAWRTWRPVLIPEKCIHCYKCWKVCPDVAISVESPEEKSLPVWDYDYCKGCGLCAFECPKDAIEMQREVDQ